MDSHFIATTYRGLARSCLALCFGIASTLAALSVAALAAVLVLLGVLGVSCRRPPETGAARAVTLAPGTPVLSLDPTLTEGTTYSALSNVFEPLVAYDPQLQIVPALATRWSTPDENTWVFALRPGVLFHDGTLLDAAVVASALDRARTAPESTARGALWAVSEVEATGPLAIRIRTSVPDALLLHELTLVFVARGSSRAEVEATPVGTGPYRVAAWDPAGALDLVAWENHWAGPPAIPSLRIAPLPKRGDGVRSVSLELIAKARASGIYVIARVVVFKDRQLYNYDGYKYALWNSATNQPWRHLTQVQEEPPPLPAEPTEEGAEPPPM